MPGFILSRAFLYSIKCKHCKPSSEAILQHVLCLHYHSNYFKVYAWHQGFNRCPAVMIKESSHIWGNSAILLTPWSVPGTWIFMLISYHFLFLGCPDHASITVDGSTDCDVTTRPKAEYSYTEGTDHKEYSVMDTMSYFLHIVAPAFHEKREKTFEISFLWFQKSLQWECYVLHRTFWNFASIIVMI